MNYLAVYLAFKKVLIQHGTENLLREYAYQYHFNDVNQPLNIYCKRKPKHLIKLTSGNRDEVLRDKGLEECLFKWTK